MDREALVRGLRWALAALVHGLRWAWHAFVRGSRWVLAALVHGARWTLAAIVYGIRWTLSVIVRGARWSLAAIVHALRWSLATIVHALRWTLAAILHALRWTLAEIVHALRWTLAAILHALRWTLAAIVYGIRWTLSVIVCGARWSLAAILYALRWSLAAILRGLRWTLATIVHALRWSLAATVRGLRWTREATVRWLRSAIRQLVRFWRSEPAIDAARVAAVAALLALPLLGLRLIDSPQGLGLEYRLPWVAATALAVFFARLFLTEARRAARLVRKRIADNAAETKRLGAWSGRIPKLGLATAAAMLFAAGLPFLPFADRNLIDRATLILIYVMLGTGLNITVGLAGLLDLGYVAFYAVGAYSYALLAQHFGLSFWACLPVAALLAASFGLVLAFPVLRLRGDYLAIVTLGFGQIVHTVLVNWTALTNGPNGLASIPRPDFFGHPFAAEAPEGVKSFEQIFDIPFSPLHRLYFLYYLILAMVMIGGALVWRLRQLPIGLAWEALREDEIACRSVGIDPRRVKLSAFALGASFAGLAGCLFAARQGFISPESFTFNESAIILAIVVLSGMRSQIGIALAAIVLIGIPEFFRDLAEYRMLAFAAVMVLIVLQRPKGLAGERRPTVRLKLVPAETAAVAEA